MSPCVLRLFMNPKSLLVRCFHVSIVCAHICTHIDHNKIWSLHVSIQCALLDCLFCCFVFTLFTIKLDPLMLQQCVHSQITFSCCFVLSLVTVIFDPFVLGLFVQSETIFVICFAFTLITIKYDPLMFPLLVHCLMTFLPCFVFRLITIKSDP